MDHASRGFDVVGQLAALRCYARSLTRSETQAEDLVHDTLVRAYERRDTLRTGAHLRPWLLSILHNIFVDERRRTQAQARREGDIAQLTELATPPDQDDRVHLDQIRTAFLELPDEQRAVLHLVAIEGLSYQDAAATLGIPLGTLMSRLGRARAALRAFEAGADVPTGLTSRPKPHLRVVGGSDD
jgi:RNA polymerase sigma-70 factor (ECF subfamily)